MFKTISKFQLYLSEAVTCNWTGYCDMTRCRAIEVLIQISPQTVLDSYIFICVGVHCHQIVWLVFVLQRVYGSYHNSDITCTSPSLQSIMIIIGQVAKGTKYVFNTTQVGNYVFLDRFDLICGTV